MSRCLNSTTEEDAVDLAGACFRILNNMAGTLTKDEALEDPQVSRRKSVVRRKLTV